MPQHLRFMISLLISSHRYSNFRVKIYICTIRERKKKDIINLILNIQLLTTKCIYMHKDVTGLYFVLVSTVVESKQPGEVWSEKSEKIEN
jgi:hypothetical protein